MLTDAAITRRARKDARIKPAKAAQCSMSEHAEQVALFRWADLASKQWPELRLLYACPNGGARSKAAAGKLKAEGVKAGIPDICLPVPRGLLGACYIELKRPKSAGKPAGRESDAQRVMRLALIEAGNHAVVAVGWIEAKAVLEQYLHVSPSVPAASGAP